MTKFSKEEVGYRTQSKIYRCSKCRYFIEGKNACQSVESEILPNATCVLWKYKKFSTFSLKGAPSREDPPWIINIPLTTGQAILKYYDTIHNLRRLK